MIRYLEDLWCLKKQVKHAELVDPICEPARQIHCMIKINICTKKKPFSAQHKVLDRSCLKSWKTFYDMEGHNEAYTLCLNFLLQEESKSFANFLTETQKKTNREDSYTHKKVLYFLTSWVHAFTFEVLHWICFVQMSQMMQNSLLK